MRRVAASCLGCLVVFALLGDVLAREWTDRQGRTASGDFVRVFQGNVVLRRGKQIVQIPFANFSPEDQEYVKKELEKKNQGYLLQGVPTEPVVPENPEVDPATDPAAGQNGNPAVAAPMFPEMNGGVVPSPIGPGAPVPTPPVINSPLFPGAGNPTPQPPSDPALDPVDTASVPSPIHNAIPATQGHQPNPWQNIPSTPAPVTPTFDPPREVFTPPPSTPPPPSIPSPYGHPSQQYSKYCSNCKKTVPDHLTAGDSCPHCHVTFETDDTNGKSVFTMRRLGSVIFVIVAVLAFLVRVFNR